MEELNLINTRIERLERKISELNILQDEAERQGNIQKQLLDLTDKQTLLTNIVQKHDHIISELIKDMAHLTEIVQTLIMYNPALVYAKLEQNIKLIEDRLTILFNTIQQLHSMLI